MPPNGVEWLLSKTIEAGLSSGAITGKALKRVAVDTMQPLFRAEKQRLTSPQQRFFRGGHIARLAPLV